MTNSVHNEVVGKDEVISVCCYPSDSNSWPKTRRSDDHIQTGRSLEMKRPVPSDKVVVSSGLYSGV